MKKTLILMAAASAFVLTGCTESDLSGDTSLAKESAPGAIEFSAKTRNAGETRAAYEKGPIDNSDTDQGLKNAKFGVFSYLTKDDYTTSTSKAPDFMYDQEVSWTSPNWVYSPVKYWPNGNDAANAANDPSKTALQDETYAKKLSFFAYAPYMAMSSFGTDGTGTANTDFPSALSASTNFKTVANPTTTNGIVGMTTNTFEGNVWLKFNMPTATTKEAVDLLWGVRGSGTYKETDGSDNTGDVSTTYNINLTKQTVTEKVSFLFKHALAKLGGSTVTTTEDLNAASSNCDFLIKVDVDNNYGSSQTDYFNSDFDNTKTLVTVKDVKIEDAKTAHDRDNRITEAASDLFKDGWFNIETGTWDMTGAQTGGTLNINVQNGSEDKEANKYTLNPQIKEVGVGAATGQKAVPTGTPAVWNNTNPTGVTVDALPLYANENAPAIMLIPGNADQTIYVTVDYIVRTADGNLSTKYSEVEQVITNKVVLPHDLLKSNNVYKIIMHLGLTSVKFEAIVSDWQTKENSSVDKDGHETGGDVNNDRNVWLPSNVVSTAASITVANQSNATANVAKDANAGYQIKVTGMTANAAYTVTSSDNTNAGVTAAGTADANGVATITVDLKENTGSARSFVIKVTETSGSKVTQITINQAAGA